MKNELIKLLMHIKCHFLSQETFINYPRKHSFSKTVSGKLFKLRCHVDCIDFKTGFRLKTTSSVSFVGKCAESCPRWPIVFPDLEMLAVGCIQASWCLFKLSASTFIGLFSSVHSKEMKGESLRPSFNSSLFLVDCEGQQCQGTLAESAMSQTVSLYSVGNSRGI